jgi:hypothetical protein
MLSLSRKNLHNSGKYIDLLACCALPEYLSLQDANWFKNEKTTREIASHAFFTFSAGEQSAATPCLSQAFFL